VKYLTLIRAIALLHQYQRPVRTVEHRGETVPYIEVTLDDIAVANRLAHQVLGRSLDELPPQTRRLLLALDRMVTEGCEAQEVRRKDFRFSRRAVREATGWSHTQVRIHLERLVELEYVLVHRGGRGQSFEYELLYDGQGQDGASFLAGLIDAEALKKEPYDGHLAGGWRGQNGPRTGGWRGEPTTLSARLDTPEPTLAAQSPENASREAVVKPRPNVTAALR
jgi:hypothetical protein